MSLLKDVKENWVLILFIGSLVVSWTTFNSRLTVVESENNEIKEQLTAVVEMRQDIAVIKNDVGYLKANLNK